MSNGRGIGTLIDASDSPVNNDKEKANLLKNYYFLLGMYDRQWWCSTVNWIVPANAALDDIDFKRDPVLRALKKIKPNESSGSDDLSTVFFLENF